MRPVSWCFAALLGLSGLGYASAANVDWPAMELYSYGTTDGTYYCMLSTVVPGYAVGVWLSISQVNVLRYTLQGETATAANGVYLYRAVYGDAVSHDSVLAASPIVDNTEFALGSTSIYVNQVFYLGFWMGGVEGIGGAGSVYGWAALKWDRTSLLLLDSAAETTGVGLYAGTYNAIPEPSAAGLILAGFSALALKRKRRSESIDKCRKSRYVLVKHRN